MNQRTTSIRVYPVMNAFRYSTQFLGLQQCIPAAHIEFTTEGFPRFHHHCMAFIIEGAPPLRLYISTGDGPGYSTDGLEWCDLYVKRTLFLEEIPAGFAHKIIPLGPHLGVRAWSLHTTLMLALRSIFAGSDSISSLREHMWAYLKQYFYRRPEDEYVPGISDPSYIFYASWLYPTHPRYNSYRATFINACHNIADVQFEGGLIRTDNQLIEEYLPITIRRYYRISAWIQRTQRSAITFWAPGDQGAMTLKMAEFMALGKAIICAPHNPEMYPSPLVHGEHVYFTDGSFLQIRHAVLRLLGDDDYRMRLERNARKYYEKHLAPRKAMMRYLEEASRRNRNSQSENL